MKSQLRSVKSLLRKAGLLDKIELLGRSYEWEVEAPNQEIGEEVRKVLRANGISTGGYTTGYGGEIIRDGGNDVDMGDWNDPSSRWHY